MPSDLTISRRHFVASSAALAATAALAVTFLGERFQGFHLAGIALVLGGVMIATFPLDWLRRRFGSA